MKHRAINQSWQLECSQPTEVWAAGKQLEVENPSSKSCVCKQRGSSSSNGQGHPGALGSGPPAVPMVHPKDGQEADPPWVAALLQELQAAK